MLETKRGAEAADASPKPCRKFKTGQDTIEYMKEKKIGALETERKQELRIGALEEFKRVSIREVRIFDNEVSEVEKWLELASGAQSSKAEVWSLTSLGLKSTGRARWGTKAEAVLEVRKRRGRQRSDRSQRKLRSADRANRTIWRWTEEGMKELSFVPSAVSDTAGWHKARSMCDKRCVTRLQVQ